MNTHQTFCAIALQELAKEHARRAELLRDHGNNLSFPYFQRLEDRIEAVHHQKLARRAWIAQAHYRGLIE